MALWRDHPWELWGSLGRPPCWGPCTSRCSTMPPQAHWSSTAHAFAQHQFSMWRIFGSKADKQCCLFLIKDKLWITACDLSWLNHSQKGNKYTPKMWLKVYLESDLWVWCMYNMESVLSQPTVNNHKLRSLHRNPSLQREHFHSSIETFGWYRNITGKWREK